eukprot:g10631.t1
MVKGKTTEEGTETAIKGGIQRIEKLVLYIESLQKVCVQLCKPQPIKQTNIHIEKGNNTTLEVQLVVENHKKNREGCENFQCLNPTEDSCTTASRKKFMSDYKIFADQRKKMVHNYNMLKEKFPDADKCLSYEKEDIKRFLRFAIDNVDLQLKRGRACFSGKPGKAKLNDLSINFPSLGNTFSTNAPSCSRDVDGLPWLNERNFKLHTSGLYYELECEKEIIGVDYDSGRLEFKSALCRRLVTCQGANENGPIASNFNFTCVNGNESYTVALEFDCDLGKYKKPKFYHHTILYDARTEYRIGLAMSARPPRCVTRVIPKKYDCHEMCNGMAANKYCLVKNNRKCIIKNVSDHCIKKNSEDLEKVLYCDELTEEVEEEKKNYKEKTLGKKKSDKFLADELDIKNSDEKEILALEDERILKKQKSAEFLADELAIEKSNEFLAVPKRKQATEARKRRLLQEGDGGC